MLFFAFQELQLVGGGGRREGEEFFGDLRVGVDGGRDGSREGAGRGDEEWGRRDRKEQGAEVFPSLARPHRLCVDRVLC